MTTLDRIHFRRPFRYLVAWIVVSFLVGSSLRADTPAEQTGAHRNDIVMAVVQLDEGARVAAGPVRIKDLGQIWATDADLEKRVGNVRILDISTDEPLTITPEQIRARLEAADFGAETVRIVGAECTVIAEGESTESNPLAIALRDAVAKRWNVSDEDVLIEVLQPKNPPMPAGSQGAEWQIILPDGLQPGRISARAALIRGSIVLRTLPVQASLSLFGNVAVAADTIPRQRRLQAADVRVERRSLANLEERWSEDKWVGKTARQAIQAGQVVHIQYLSEEAQTQELVIKPRAVVRLAVRKGGLTVTAVGGEALQGGHIGDWIRVRNPQSGKIVTGRITGPDEVEVPL